MNDLGEEIRKKRQEMGLSIEELSQKTMLSVAIIRDIENGNFDRYEGDETYVKMYLRKISSALNLDEEEITQSYVALTQKMKQEEEDKAKAQAESSGEDVQKHKDFQFERPNYSTKGSVYQDKPSTKYVKGIIVVVLVALICAVVYFGVSYSKNKTASKNYTQNTNNAEGKVNTSPKKKKTAPKKAPAVKKKAKKKDTKITFKRQGNYRYSITIGKDVKKLNLRIVVGSRSWFDATLNGSPVNSMQSRIYARGETINQTFNASSFNQLMIHAGYTAGSRYYINNVQIPLTDVESRGTVTRLYITNAKS